MSIKLQTEDDIKALIESDSQMMRVLQIVSGLNLPDWMIGGGWLRNKVWDQLSNGSEDNVMDIDVSYYDSKKLEPEIDWKIDDRLKELYPEFNFQVRNQARMHYYNGFKQYLSTEDSMAHWPETATAIGVKLVDDQVVLRFIYGVEDLLNLIARPTKYFTGDKIEVFRQRVVGKGWQGHWPSLRIIEK